MIELTVYGALKRGVGGAERFRLSKVFCQNIIALHTQDVIRAGDDDGHQLNHQRLRAFTVIIDRSCSLLLGESGEGGHDLRVVKAGHQTHVAIAVVHHHKGSFGDIQHGLVVTNCRDMARLFCQGNRRASGACPNAMIECRTGRVCSKVTACIRHALNLHVVGVKAVLACGVISSLGFALARSFGVCARLACVSVAHLTVNIEVGLHLPLNVLRDVTREGRLIDKSNGIAAVLGILVRLLHEVGRGLDTTLRSCARISAGVVALHGVSDIEVGLDLVYLIINGGVVVRDVSKAGGVVGITSFGGVAAGVIDNNGLTAHGIFVVARHFGSRGIPVVLLHHRAVVSLQFILLGHRHTHDLPSVLIQEDDLRLQHHFLHGEFTGAHRYGLEPVVALPESLTARRGITPGGGVSP